MRQSFNKKGSRWGGAGQALAALLLGAALIALARLGGLERFDVAGTLAVLREAGESGLAVPAFLALYVGLTSVVVPAFPLHMAAALAFGLWPAMALNVLCCNLAGNLQFWAARWGGRKGLRLFARHTAAIEAHGLRSMVAIRLLPIPTLVVNVGAGLSPMRWRDFALGSLVGTLPMIAAYTWFADAIAEGAAGARAQVLWRAAAAGGVLVALAWGPVLWRTLAARRRRRVLDAPGRP